MSAKRTAAQDPQQGETIAVIELVKSYLNDDQMRFHQISEEALELYMQGNNLTMHLVIYVHNGHLIFRIPSFIRNVELRTMEVMLFIMQVSSDILDIRFEIGKDGKSLSACCQHILEDALPTRKQFDLAMMVLMHIVDDTFPHFMQLIYGDEKAELARSAPDSKPAEPEVKSEEAEENEEFAPVIDDDETRNIN